MKASFAATHPLKTIKRFVAVYSDDHSRKRDRAELRQCGFRSGTATALVQSAREQGRHPAARGLDVGRAVQDARAGAPLRARGAPGRQPRVDEEADRGEGAPAAREHAAAGRARSRGRDEAHGRRKASLTIVLVPRGQRVAVLTLTSQTGFNPYPQARNLMRRMLGMKPLGVPKPKPGREPPPIGVPVEAARFVRR